MIIERQYMEIYQKILVPIGNGKIKEEIEFFPRAPVLNIIQVRIWIIKNHLRIQ